MAGLSIYDVSYWVANTQYNLWDIYEYPRYSQKYYYSLSKHNSGLTFNSAFSGGISTYNGKVKPKFIWIPSYNSNIEVKPSIKEVRFGDGFVQRSPDGINNILLPFNLTFDKRTDAETRAILHFLNTRAGHQSFIFMPPPPFNINKLFVCAQWRHNIVFQNNNTIDCQFQETVA
jgi:phage-related protein